MMGYGRPKPVTTLPTSAMGAQGPNTNRNELEWAMPLRHLPLAENEEGRRSDVLAMTRKKTNREGERELLKSPHLLGLEENRGPSLRPSYRPPVLLAAYDMEKARKRRGAGLQDCDIID